MAPHPVTQFRGKLLIVDENLDDLLDYSQVLERVGYDVRCIGTITDGAISLDNESFELIIIGRGSPDLAGRSVLGACRR